MYRKLRITLATILVFVLGIGVQNGIAQQPFMTPYEPDSNTVMLFHFNGNTENSSNLAVEDAIPHGSVTYTSSNIGDDFGQMIWLDNDSPSDSTYLHIPDTSAMDIRGNWTMEVWVNLLTYGTGGDDWRWRPKMLVKPGDQTPSHSNYFNVLRADLRAFHTGYYSPSGGNWFAATSPNNSFFAGKWYHVAYIRDTTNNLLVQLIHDKEGELLYFTTGQYDPILNHPPSQTDAPAYIGINLGQGGGWLDGFLDEMRVSNVVRSFDTPPILTGVSSPGNQQPNTPTEVTLNVNNLEGNTVDNVNLRYDAGSGWQSVSMAENAEGKYAADIPGLSSGTTVEYYVRGSNTNGLSATKPSSATDTSGTYYNFAVVDTGQVAHLDFEGSDMPPTNKQGPDLNIQAMGQPTIDSETGADGTSSSLYLEGDSSYLEVSNPHAAFLKSQEFVVDFWFQAQDSVPEFGTRLLIKEGGSSWNNFNYQIWTTGGGDITPASYVPNGTNPVRTGSVTGLDSVFTPNEWYRIVYLAETDSLYARFYGSDNELIQEVGGGIDGDMNLSNGPFRIGVHDGALGDTEEPFGVPDGPLFRGWIDEVKFYNTIPDEYVTTNIKEPSELPQKVTLGKNYPNPFNPATKINYSLPTAKDVSLKVYDVLGREVTTLVDAKQQAGTYTVTFDARQYSSGVYFYRLKTENVSKVRKMLLVK